METKASKTDISSKDMLTARLAANKMATRDFDEWCIRQLPELPMPAKVMDIGCGTGKQLNLFGPLLSPKSTLMGMDLSEASIQTAKDSYRGAAQLAAEVGSFDELDSMNLPDGEWDLIYAVYAMYYTQDLPKLIREVHRLLKPGGICWVIAPYFGTNDEFLRILRPLHEVEDFMDYVFDRFHQEVIAEGESVGFSSLKTSHLRNEVRFPHPEAFMKYLRNSLFYRAGHDDAIAREVQAVCDAQGYFGVSKRIISIQLRK
ncbi:class I SAM-dependent methyltransferase [Pontibacter sp. G13]|uniref:class I SAM-dependent methyltransferase n=1 Tax=Pontibacter sp. G13 TaxID=3074898 RepID=UPI00288A2596|nr:class I SAM-dependent methyltransferase [Pontibacter sp. G13]WNJ16275.1 class I SAM-dependent methyltransferase [Pontibacter sp. G13]